MDEYSISRLSINFDVPSNYISATDYIIALESLKSSVEALNKNLLNNKLDYEFITFGAEAGSVRGKIGIKSKILIISSVVLGGATELVRFLESDFGKGLTKGLGYEINTQEIGMNVGVFIRDVVVEIFSIPTEDINKTIPKSINLDKVLSEKTKFYKMCLNNSSIRAVGFTEDSEFPIKRVVFHQHISNDVIRPVDSEFVICKAIIVSPVDIDIDQVWRFQDMNTKSSFSAYMRDENFKRSFLNGKYPLKKSNKDDKIIMELEYKKQEKNGEIEQKEVCVYKVYHFNDIEIIEIPKDRVENTNITQKNSLPMDDLWKQK